MLPRGLSMLWEANEPGVALRERFGFEGAAEAVGWVRATLVEAWGTASTDAGRLVISDQNLLTWVHSEHGRLVVKGSRNRRRFAELEASTRWAARLSRQGLPVLAPLPATDGRLRVLREAPSGPLSVAVWPEVSGDWLDPDDPEAVRDAGRCLARLHAALAADPAADGPSTPAEASPTSDPSEPGGPRNPPELPPLERRVVDWLDHHDHGWAPAVSARLRAAIEALPPPTERPQLVHRDLRAANLLTRGSRVVAVLDLDDVTRDHRLVDLARSALYLGTRFHDWEPTPSSVRAEFLAGYASARPLDPVEAAWVEALVGWQALLTVSGPGDPAGWAAAW